MENWVGITALGVSCLVGIVGYLSRPTFVPSSRAQELRDQVENLREQVEALRKDNAALDVQVRSLRSDAEFWQSEYRKLRSEVSKP